ncbi:MAG TPA: hypothetical protein VMW49_07380, partial [Candidatus Dormibacteraeota bacterium]|nr:hypothetical protein [Candidatus Dormibacteraeota bacterium]
MAEPPGGPLTVAYLRRYRQAARQVLPGWWHQAIHRIALPQSGGDARASRAADGSPIEVAPAAVPAGSPPDRAILGGEPTLAAHDIDPDALARAMRLAKQMTDGPGTVPMEEGDTGEADALSQTTNQVTDGAGGWEDALPMLVSLLATPGLSQDLT